MIIEPISIINLPYRRGKRGTIKIIFGNCVMKNEIIIYDEIII